MPDANAELARAVRAEFPASLHILNLSSFPKDLHDIAGKLSKEDRLLFVELLLRMLFSALVDADYRDTSAFYTPMSKTAPMLVPITRARAVRESLREMRVRECSSM